MTFSGVQLLQVASQVALAVTTGPNMVSEVISEHIISKKFIPGGACP